ncbi:MAG: serine/threonine-protein kinase [Patescibacteria group bacterium]|nr:serine/threonine-protein kinase [Patescibacteria group bacterium]
MLSTLMPGFEINNRYHIRREKRGGMGVVYICFDKELQETVALKTFQKKYVLDKSMRDIFYAEANNWVDLGRHKNIVHAKRVEIIEFQPFIIIEYISGHDYYGPSLRDWITQQGLDLAIALSFAIQVCDAMIHIERVSKEKGNRLVHKDLKPDNIMITNDEIIKVTDFGLIGSTAQGGTPAYMSPEQWLGEDDIDIRSDIYSFGCVLYEMITGKWFFDIQGLDPKECFDHHINTLPSCIDGVSDTLNRLIQKCLAKKAGERYASFSQLKEQILHIYGGGVKRIEVDLKTDDDKEDWVQTAFNLTNLGRFSEALNLF